MGKRRIAGHPRERQHLEDLGIDGTIVLKCILNNWAGRA
jgi:hypothetical protein